MSKTASESNHRSTCPEQSSTPPHWSVACHICNRISRDGNDGLLQHYVDEHPRSAVARRGSLLDPRNYMRVM